MGATAGSGYSNAVDLYTGSSGTNVLLTAAFITSSITPATSVFGLPTTAPAAPTSTAAVAPSTSAPVGVVVGASVGGVMCVVLLAAAVWRWRKYISQVHSCSTLVLGFVPCS